MITKEEQEILTEGGKGLLYVLGLLWLSVSSEHKRKRGTAQHDAKSVEREVTRETKLNERFNTMSREINERHAATDLTMAEIDTKMTILSTVVGVDNEDGLRGQLREIKGAVEQLKRDNLVKADPRLRGGSDREVTP